MRIGVLLSTGKDSLFAMYKAIEAGHEAVCLITLHSENPHSWMFHTPNVELVDAQAECLGLPLVKMATKGEKEKELADLERAIARAKQRYRLDGIVTGALYSRYQWTRIDRICGDHELVGIAPLWHYDQEKLLRDLIKEDFQIIISSVACDGMNMDWIGKRLDLKMIDRLIGLREKIGINIAGEGGEYESLVLDCPMFSKRISVLHSRIEMEDTHTGEMVVEKFRLVDKR